MSYDLPNPFLFLSVGGNAAPVAVNSLPSGESDPAVTLDCAGAAPGYQCCTDCGMCDPCDEHCPWSGKSVPTSPEPTARFQLDEAALMSDIEPVPAFITRPHEYDYQAAIDKLNRSTDRDIAANEIEELLQLARAEDWPSPPRRMAG